MSRSYIEDSPDCGRANPLKSDQNRVKPPIFRLAGGSTCFNWLGLSVTGHTIGFTKSGRVRLIEVESVGEWPIAHWLDAAIIETF